MIFLPITAPLPEFEFLRPDNRVESQFFAAYVDLFWYKVQLAVYREIVIGVT